MAAAKKVKPVPKTSLKGFKGRVQINDSITIMEIDSSDARSNSVRWTSAEGFKQIELLSGTHNVDIDFCSAFSNETVKIRRVRLEFRRVD